MITTCGKDTVIKIITPSRLHITLIDLNASLGRVDGGVGITLDEPSMILKAKKSDLNEIKVTGSESPDQIEDRIKKSVRAVMGQNEFGVNIDIEKAFPMHVGLGSGTQISLASGMAVNELYDLSLSVRKVAELVGRGGTSGIGVTSFEAGGFIVDGGHFFSEKGAFAPSSVSLVPPPPVIFRRDFPDWDIVLAIPNLTGTHDEKEVDIFNKVCPIPIGEVQAVSHIILMKMLPSLIEKDIANFGESVSEIQKVGFKKREVELQHPIIDVIMEEMVKNGAYGAGMSSFGPVVYCVADNPKRIKKGIQKILDDSLGGKTFITKARNEGAKIFEYKKNSDPV